MHINAKNKFKQRFFQDKAVYEQLYKLRLKVITLDPTPDSPPAEVLQWAVPLHKSMQETLSYTPTGDNAFEYLHQQESTLRRICFYAHVVAAAMTGEAKQFCLYIDHTSVIAVKDVIEICDVYGFGYMYVERYAGDRHHAIVIDLRNKDLDSETFLEAWDLFEDILNPKDRLKQSALTSLEYAGCFFD